MRRRIGTLFVALALLAPAGVGAQEVTAAGSDGLTISGFISATFYAQDQLFGLFTQGQAAATAPTAELTEDNWFHGGDVRNTRISLGFHREATRGWTTGARLELDLFGGWNGNEPFGDEMPIPRLRLAYADLSNGSTTIRVGQAWAPIFGAVPNSLSHVAFPLGYGSGGVIGWRFPGIFLIHRPEVEDGEISWGVQVAAMAGSWTHVNPGATPDDPSPAEAGLFPQLEIRLDLSGESEAAAWTAYFVGHIDRKDPDGVGVDTGVDAITGTALEAGGQLRPGPVTVQGNVYYGEAVGHLLGALTQPGDYKGFGGWGQLGYQASDRVSFWGFAGFDTADDGGAVLPAGARESNQILALSARYDLPGYAVGLEWLNADTEFVGASGSSTANQISLSVMYSF